MRTLNLSFLASLVAIVSLGCDHPASQPGGGGPPGGGGSGGSPFDFTALPGSLPDASLPIDAGGVVDLLGPATDLPAPVACSGKSVGPNPDTWTIDVGGAKRSAIVHVPPGYDGTRGLPLLLNLHGFSSDPKQQESYTQTDAKADAVGFLVIYPTGLSNSWDAGVCCGASSINRVDDISFIRALLDTATEKLCVDPKRVYATGFSNGGFMVNRMACEMAGRIAAIAPVAGVLGVSTCTPSRPMPVMHFHGTGDKLVPYNGSLLLRYPSVADSIAGWVKRDGCTGDPVETFRKGDSHCSSYRTCNAGSEVVLCTVDDGGHTWPGAGPPPGNFGKTTKDLSANDAMWDFFIAHPLP